MSRKYDVRGYYYRFPNSEFDAIGYGDESATPQKFRDILKKKNIPETKLRGCHIYLKNDYPINDRVILIGDAGGFANRVTSEGIKAAFETARNAAEAIKSGRPFREVNAPMFEKMAKEERFAQFFYKPSTVWFLGVLCHIPGAVKWFFDRALRPRD
jgi:flavin-dependent dehydrogenase